MTQMVDQHHFPQYATALALHRAGRLEEAAFAYAQMLRADPRTAEAWHLLGVIACQGGRLREGAQHFRKAVELQPGFLLGWMDLGAALREQSDTAGAVACFDHVLAIDPAHADAHISRGEALCVQGRHEDALGSFESAIRLDAQDARAHNNAGNALLEMGSYDAALARFDRAVALRPGYVRALSNRGCALHALGRYADSIAQCNSALALQPDFGEARAHRGLTSLLLGDFRQGWIDNEARWQTMGTPQPRRFSHARWNGEADIDGKTILLHAEQGLGDTVQFCRYARPVADRGARVILQVQPELVSLLRTLDGPSQIVSEGDPLPDFDVHCPLLSLPLAFGTDLTSIPSGAAYLHVDKARVSQWRMRLGPKSSRLRIGLVWSGSSGHKNDRNRSIPLQDLLDALQGIDAEFVSLQKEVRDRDATALAGAARVLPLGTELQDFADTAALASLVDLVVTVDTAVAHLAAAVGKTTWILLPWVPDWRWQLDRRESPWYREVRLFRQPAPGDWPAVLSALRAELDELAI